MKRFLCLAIALAPGFLGLAHAQDPADAVTVDPDVHRVIIDNEFIRVFDARASRGTKSPMHTHPPMVLVSVGKTRLRMSTPDGKTSLFDLNPGNVFWIQDAKHSWELLAGELHAIGVEIKSAQSKAPEPVIPARPAIDSAAIDPDAHHVLLENPHVRVYEGRTSHGRTSPMHWHPPALALSLEWIRLKTKLPDGTNSILDFSPGQVIWLPDGLTHSWEAIAGSGRVMVIEVKAALAAKKN